jgi:hypothetical protein
MNDAPKMHSLVTARGQAEKFTVFSSHTESKTAKLKTVASPGYPSLLFENIPWADIFYLENRDAIHIARPATGPNTRQ